MSLVSRETKGNEIIKKSVKNETNYLLLAGAGASALFGSGILTFVFLALAGVNTVYRRHLLNNYDDTKDARNVIAYIETNSAVVKSARIIVGLYVFASFLHFIFG